MARWNGPDGTPYIFLTKSGNVPPKCGAAVDRGHGYLIVARMGSRDKHGERLRSNLWPFALTPPARHGSADVLLADIAVAGGCARPARPSPGVPRPSPPARSLPSYRPPFPSQPPAAFPTFPVSPPERRRCQNQLDLPQFDGPWC